MNPTGNGHRARNFARQTARLSRRIETLETVSRRLSWARLGIVLGGLILAAGVYTAMGEPAAWGTLIAALAGFVFLANRHNRVEKSLVRHRIFHRIKAAHEARIALNWAALPSPHPAKPGATHPFAHDLNVVGERSLLHLMDTTRSTQGAERLQQGLLAPILEPEAIRHRQALVAELIPLSGFRDRLALNSALTEADMDRRWDGEAITRWLETHTPGRSLLPFVIALSALSCFTLISGALSAFGIGPTLWPVTLPLYLIAYLGIYMANAQALGALLRDADRLSHALAPFHAVLLFLETHRFARSPNLSALCAPLQTADRPSQHLHRLRRIAGAAQWQQGQLLWVLLNALVPWDMFFAHQLNRCKADIKTRLPAWLEIWYDLEALCALASFGAMQTPACFPEITAEPILDIANAGHPLIPATARVCNAFSFRGPGDVVIVTGSNMSGKSTFLRTIGLNLCLAYAGAPIIASAMRTGLFRVFTCIAVSDSVTDGLSHFYAEIKRLKALLHALQTDHPLPLFFLIDEIFRGTNNRERLIGSRAYLRALTAHNGLGMVTTHDLELSRLENDLPGIRNIHFRETIEQDRMSFDYQLHTGPCPTTNALALMKLEGLPVDWKGED